MHLRIVRASSKGKERSASQRTRTSIRLRSRTSLPLARRSLAFRKDRALSIRTRTTQTRAFRRAPHAQQATRRPLHADAQQRKGRYPPKRGTHSADRCSAAEPAVGCHKQSGATHAAFCHSYLSASRGFSVMASSGMFFQWWDISGGFALGAKSAATPLAVQLSVAPGTVRRIAIVSQNTGTISGPDTTLLLQQL